MVWLNDHWPWTMLNFYKLLVCAHVCSFLFVFLVFFLITHSGIRAVLKIFCVTLISVAFRSASWTFRPFWTCVRGRFPVIGRFVCLSLYDVCCQYMYSAFQTVHGAKHPVTVRPVCNKTSCLLVAVFTFCLLSSRLPTRYIRPQLHGSV